MDDFRIIESKQVHAGRVINVFVERILLPDGKEAVREVVRHRGAAAIVPMLSHDEVILIKQFRYSAAKTLWEIPAGTLEIGEKPITCAERELIEETGYRAGAISPLGGFYVSPGFCDEFIHLFMATDLERCGPNLSKLDSDEQLEVHGVSLGEALRKIESGEIVDAKTIIGLARVNSRVRRDNTA